MPRYVWWLRRTVSYIGVLYIGVGIGIVLFIGVMVYGTVPYIGVVHFFPGPSLKELDVSPET